MANKADILEAINTAIAAGTYTPTHFSGFVPDNQSYPHSVGDLDSDAVEQGFTNDTQLHSFTYLVTIYDERSDGGKSLYSYGEQLQAILDNTTLSSVTGWGNVGLILESTTPLLPNGDEELSFTLTWRVYATEV